MNHSSGYRSHAMDRHGFRSCVDLGLSSGRRLENEVLAGGLVFP